MAGSSFSVDVAAIRERVRQKMDQGPVTEHVDEERQHAIWTAERISQLGGDPDFDPATRRVMEKILQKEEEHADDIVDLLAK
jgi:bacterioferritin (cytochrome b1)